MYVTYEPENHWRNKVFARLENFEKLNGNFNATCTLIGIFIFVFRNMTMLLFIKYFKALLIEWFQSHKCSFNILLTRVMFLVACVGPVIVLLLVYP